jgi:hypothetical protein
VSTINDPKGVRIDIDTRFDTLVMGEWYRDALSIAATTQSNNRTGAVPLVVKKVRCWGWRSLRSACHHPDPVVRLATRLGVLGTWLGLVALVDPALKVYEHFDGFYGRLGLAKSLGISGPPEYLHACAMIGIALVFAAPGVRACWGRPRPLSR